MAAPSELRLRRPIGTDGEPQAIFNTEAATNNRSDAVLRLETVFSLTLATCAMICGIFSSFPMSLSHVWHHSVIMGLTPCALALVVLATALRQSGQSLVQSVLREKRGKLYESGVHSISRNPDLAAMLLLLTGVGFCANTWWGCIFSTLLFFWWNLVIVPAEERQLRSQFGLVFVSYCERTPRWV